MPAKKYPLPLINRTPQLTSKTPDTIRRWAKAGCNISDDDEVLAWTKEKGHNKSKRKIKPSDLKPKLTAPTEKPETLDLKMLDRLPASQCESGSDDPFDG